MTHHNKGLSITQTIKRILPQLNKHQQKQLSFLLKNSSSPSFKGAGGFLQHSQSPPASCIFKTADKGQKYHHTIVPYDLTKRAISHHKQ